MFNFVHSCLTKNVIKLGGVFSCVMAFDIILSLNCYRILSDEGDNTSDMWDNKIVRAPFTVEDSSFIINFSFLAADILFFLKSSQK